MDNVKTQIDLLMKVSNPRFPNDTEPWLLIAFAYKTASDIQKKVDDMVQNIPAPTS